MSAQTERPATGSPAALRVMSVVRWLLLLAVASVAAGTWWTLVLRDAPPSDASARFYCPMHPEIRSAEPGTCPICFMRLEPIPEDLGTGGHAAVAGTDDDDVAPEPVAGEPPSGTAPVMLTTERRQASGIAVAPVARRALGTEVRWPAVTEPLDGARAEVRVRTDAFVERVVVGETGTVVRRGETLAWVYAPEILRAEEELLETRRWSATGAAGTETVGPSSLEDAAARRLELLGVPASEIAAIRSTGEARRLMPLRAPIAGTVTRIGAVRGAYAEPADVLYEITSYERVRVVATVLAPGDLPLASLDGASASFVRPHGLAPVPLVLELVEATLDDASRGARVRYLAESAGEALRPGDIGQVVLSAPAASALVVPRDAVVDRGRERYVFVETGDGLFEPRIVTAGSLRGEEREILAGLREGERVVVRGGFVLDSESRLAAALAPHAHAAGAAADEGDEARDPSHEGHGAPR